MANVFIPEKPDDHFSSKKQAIEKIEAFYGLSLFPTVLEDVYSMKTPTDKIICAFKIYKNCQDNFWQAIMMDNTF
jgi:hypothetical protein